MHVHQSMVRAFTMPTRMAHEKLRTMPTKMLLGQSIYDAESK
jgi:hypothetical protein